MTFNGIYKQHGVSLLMAVLAGAVAVGVMFTQVDATEQKVDTNTADIKQMNAVINEINVEQKVLIERVKNETEKAASFRTDTTKALDRILDKLEDIGDD